MSRALRYLLRKFYFLIAIALISLAVLVQLGRSLSPLVADYREPLVDYLSTEFNAEVQLGSLTAEWDGLKPVLDIRDLRISSQADEPILQLGGGRMRLDLLRSLFNWRPVWRHLKLEGMDLVFAQTREGFWRIPGLPDDGAVTPEAVQLDTLVDMLLLASRIEFQSSRLTFRFYSGEEISLESPELLLQNQRGFHRLTLDIDVQESKQAAYLIVEGFGDPRDQAGFRANAYLRFQNFPTREPLAATLAILLGGVTEPYMRGEGLLNAELWFNTRSRGNGLDIAGNLELQTLYVPLWEQEYRLDRFATRVKGHWLRNGQWLLTLPGISADLAHSRVEEVNLSVSAEGPGAPLELQLDRLQLANWVAVMDQAGALGQGGLRNVVRTLSPQGQLRDLHMTLPLDKPGDWQINALAEQLSTQAWRGVPALTGVDGHVQVGQRGGFINLDARSGFSAHFDPTYAQPMAYEQASGQVAWHLEPENKRIYVNSGALELRRGDEALRGYLWLSLPWGIPGDVDLYLHIGARQLAAALYAKYVPATLPDPLLDWLHTSLGEPRNGQVTQGGFIFRGTLNTPNNMARSHQLYLDVEDADLDYHRDWPDLRQVSGRLLVDDNQVRAQLTAGRLYDSQLKEARVFAAPHAEGEGMLLEVDGQLAGKAGDGLRLLRESPLRRTVGDAMDSWRLQGDYQASLNLAIPLRADQTGGRHRVVVDLDAPALDMGNFRLTLNDIKGRIRVDESNGLSSDNLEARLFGEPIRFSLDSLREQLPGQPDQTFTRIGLSGQTPVESLAAWTRSPELLFLQGKLGHETTIDLIPRAGADAGDAADPLLARVTLTSDLRDLAVRLPEPLGKPADETGNLTLQLDIHQQTRRVALDYGPPTSPLLQARLRLQGEDELLNANIALGARARLPAEPQFLLSGYLPSLQLDDWRQVQARYLQYRERLQAPANANAEAGGDVLYTGRLAGLPLRLDLTLGSHVLGPLKLEDLSLTAWHEGSYWHLNFANPMLVGHLEWPLDTRQPMAITLQELHITRQLLGDENAPPLASETELSISLLEERPQFHPRDLPRADISLGALYLDELNYGSWSLELHPDERGALFDNIRGQVRGLRVQGLKSHDTPANGQAAALETGAKLYWVVDGQGARTRFMGSLTADNLADVMAAWDKPDMIDSSSASFQVDLTWPGAPGEFALVNLEGQMDLLLTDGRFKRGAGAGEGILRLLSLVNFDTLARRLRLDFSDLYKSGLAYDQVRGRMEFSGGMLYLAEPLQVQGPSSRMQMAGTINLRDETIDARLIAALPVAGNLTFWAAIATGLPAAAGIFLVSKLFRKQVDQATSVSYRIQGDWDNPRMRFDRLFESEASLRSSVTNRREDEAAE